MAPDVKIARENLGVTTKVSPVVSVNLDPASDPAADRTTPYSTVHFAGTTTPEATVTFLDQASGSTTAATADSTGAYSIMVPLVSGSNTFTGDDSGRIRAVDQRHDLAGRLLAANDLIHDKRRPTRVLPVAPSWPSDRNVGFTEHNRVGEDSSCRPVFISASRSDRLSERGETASRTSGSGSS